MNPKYSDVIKKIRETRQQKAAFELGSKNEIRDRVLAAKSRMEEKLAQQQRRTQLQITQIYNETSGRTHCLQDVEALISKVDKEKNKVQVISTECEKLETLAQAAIEKAEKAKAVHALMLRSYEKWDKMIGINQEEIARQQENRDELLIEEIVTVSGK